MPPSRKRLGHVSEDSMAEMVGTKEEEELVGVDRLVEPETEPPR